MGIVFFGVGIGIIISIVLVGLGVEIADKRHNKRLHKRQLSNDSSGDVLFCRRLCDWSCVNGCNISVERKEPQEKQEPHTSEEKIMVLNTMRMGATWYEKTIIDEIADDIQRIEKESKNE